MVLVGTERLGNLIPTSQASLYTCRTENSAGDGAGTERHRGENCISKTSDGRPNGSTNRPQRRHLGVVLRQPTGRPASWIASYYRAKNNPTFLSAASRRNCEAVTISGSMRGIGELAIVATWTECRQTWRQGAVPSATLWPNYGREIPDTGLSVSGKCPGFLSTCAFREQWLGSY